VVKRLSAIGLETTHGYIFPAMMNGYDPVALKRNAIELVWSIFDTNGAPSVEGVRVVKCYDPDPELAARVAEACLIDTVCPDISDAYEDVDGVIVISGDSTVHRSQAIPSLERGLPTFVDKPFTATVDDALALIAASEAHAAPLFCSSSLRFADQTIALRERLPETVGTSLAAHVIGTGEYSIYAIHSLEFLLSIWGGGIVQLESTGHAGFDTIILTWADGRRAVWQVCEAMHWQFHLSVYGTAGYDQATIALSDRYHTFFRNATEIARFMNTGVTPVSPYVTLEITRLLELAALNRGRGPIPLTP
jgi:predicted dehydrogenase